MGQVNTLCIEYKWGSRNTPLKSQVIQCSYVHLLYTLSQISLLYEACGYEDQSCNLNKGAQQTKSPGTSTQLALLQCTESSGPGPNCSLKRNQEFYMSFLDRRQVKLGQNLSGCYQWMVSLRSHEYHVLQVQYEYLSTLNTSYLCVLPPLICIQYVGSYFISS